MVEILLSKGEFYRLVVSHEETTFQVPNHWLSPYIQK